MLNLVPFRGGTVRSGRVFFEGQDLLSLPEPHLRSVRGKSVGFVFQEPCAFLNPLMRLGRQIAEPLMIHEGVSHKAALREASRLLTELGVNDPCLRLRQYPFELSGGQLQRILIATAIILRPRLLIADEPTTALDVTTQHSIVRMLEEQKHRRGLAILFISHDLALVSQIADRIAVMHAGSVVEWGSTKEITRHPVHPLTRELLEAAASESAAGVFSEPGNTAAVPENAGRGCSFSPRCPISDAACAAHRPEYRLINPEHGVACHRPHDFDTA
jgi:oligopeptide/dipeptide ABC transporter ATP-binding protein